MSNSGRDNNMRFGSRAYILFFVIILIAGCSSAPPRHVTEQDSAPRHSIDVTTLKDATPVYEPYSKYGNPPSYVVFNKRYHTKTSAVGHVEQGIASWYGTKFHGRRTSSGEPYDMFAMTAAHKTLPLPTYAKVTNTQNNLSVIVKINDRGPFHDNRIIDLSYAAAKKLGFSQQGTAHVRLETITFPQHLQSATPAVENNNATTPRHYVQVGAFANRASAEQLQLRLKSVHETASIATNQQPASLYRVRLGPFISRDEATYLARQVDDYGLKPYIVTE